MARNLSYWNDTAPASAFPALTGEIEVDVAAVKPLEPIDVKAEEPVV